MHLSKLARELYDEIAELTIIDAHEHLPSEAEYLAFGYSGLNMFGNYFRLDLWSAGLPDELGFRDGGDQPVETWWPRIRPYWEAAKYTSYARALRITAREVFGIDAIGDATIHELAARVKADNTPGLYQRILQERCRIRLSLTCVDQVSFPDDPGLRGLIRPHVEVATSDVIRDLGQRVGRPIKTLGDAREAVRTVMHQALREGAVGMKMVAVNLAPRDPAAAEAELADALSTAHGGNTFKHLSAFLLEECFDIAAEADVPIAVHTGYWGDFRDLDPKLMFTFAVRRGDVRFDMFHLGMPMVRDAALIGKSLPNVTLNLTWCPIISQIQTARMLDEIIDLVPVNKVTAFGGDYRVAVQKVYGHLVMAREVVAAALGRRVEAGDLDRAEAIHVARLWFHDNPTRIYRLPRG
jgi:predicted TIM-barrel fold metal-dependent hydrolase